MAIDTAESCLQSEELPPDHSVDGNSSCLGPRLTPDTRHEPLSALAAETSSSDPYGGSRPTKTMRELLGSADPGMRVTNASTLSLQSHSNEDTREQGRKTAPRKDSGILKSQRLSDTNVPQRCCSSKRSTVQSTVCGPDTHIATEVFEDMVVGELVHKTRQFDNQGNSDAPGSTPTSVMPNSWADYTASSPGGQAVAVARSLRVGAAADSPTSARGHLIRPGLRHRYMDVV